MTAGEPVRALTSLRGVAAWWVVLYHFRDALPGAPAGMLYDVAEQGYLAVDAFFLLSGFVIAMNYAGDFHELDMARTRRFLVLRVARIYPLHLFMMFAFLLNPLAIVLFSTQGDPGLRYEPTYWLLSLLLVQNWGFTDGLMWNVPAWSISTEFFAYLIFPLLAVAMHRFARDAVAALLGVALMLLLLGGVFRMAGLGSTGNEIPHFGLLRCVLGFAAGMMLWHLRSYRPVLRQLEANLACLTALACFLAYALLPIPDYATVPLGFAFLIWGLSDDHSALARVLRVRPLEVVGLISYSTYLSHFFVKDWVLFLLVRPGMPEGVAIVAYLTGTAVASVLLYRWVEVPGRRAVRSLYERSRWAVRLGAGQHDLPPVPR